MGAGVNWLYCPESPRSRSAIVETHGKETISNCKLSDGQRCNRLWVFSSIANLQFAICNWKLSFSTVFQCFFAARHEEQLPSGQSFGEVHGICGRSHVGHFLPAMRHRSSMKCFEGTKIRSPA